MLSSNLKIVQVKLTWVDAPGRARRHPFQGEVFSTVIDFPDLKQDRLGGSAWSVVLYFNGGIIKPTIGIMSFLVDDAPHHILTPSQEFTLLEGRYVTATGEITQILPFTKKYVKMKSEGYNLIDLFHQIKKDEQDEVNIVPLLCKLFNLSPSEINLIIQSENQD